MTVWRMLSKPLYITSFRPITSYQDRYTERFHFIAIPNGFIHVFNAGFLVKWLSLIFTAHFNCLLSLHKGYEDINTGAILFI